ncbi:MAG TPA: Yip1 family protein [Ignavibacteria bacterium]|nr:Yip1 family protein [Ignavibacteria bacterium]
MTEENNTYPDTSQDQNSQFEQLTNSEAMAGVITAPSETFETIANTPKKNYWLIPVLIAIVVGLVSTFLFMQDAELVGRTMNKQKEKMMEKFEENIKDGKMTQEQVDAAMESMNPKGVFFKIMGYGGSVVGPFIVLLLLSVIYLIVLKIMQGKIDFLNIANVVGLALLIGAIGNLIAIVISILKGNMTTIGPSLFMSEESVGEKVYALLTKIDLFSIWFYAVIAIGLSKVGSLSIAKTATAVFGIWIVYIIVSSFAF